MEIFLVAMTDLLMLAAAAVMPVQLQGSCPLAWALVSPRMMTPPSPTASCSRPLALSALCAPLETRFLQTISTHTSEELLCSCWLIDGMLPCRHITISDPFFIFEKRHDDLSEVASDSHTNFLLYKHAVTSIGDDVRTKAVV